VIIFNKKQSEISFGIRTLEDTAFVGKDFKFMDQIVNLTADQTEYKLQVAVIDDDQWEPNRQFWLEIYDPKTKERMQGHDSKCKVTIIDDDEPGDLTF
jgi:solute carrier family 8 (sodium/calcium exchanger)